MKSTIRSLHNSLTLRLNTWTVRIFACVGAEAARELLASHQLALRCLQETL